MKPPIFLDFQATTPLDPRVLQAMLPWLEVPANPHSLENQPGMAAYAAVEDARVRVAAITGTDSDGVVFTPGATFACNQVIRSFADEGQRVVISAIEHPCVAETARQCSERGATLETVSVGESGLVDLDELFEHVPDSALVSVMAVNNEVGTIQPIVEIAEFCRAHDVPFHCDSAQALGRIALTELGQNAIITLSSHKAYGPQGIGAICASSSMRSKLKPLITGGGQQDGLYPGTLPTALCVGFGIACELALKERKQDWAHAVILSERFLARLQANGITYSLNGSSEERVPHNLNLSFDDVDAEALLALLPDVALATGSACSSGAIGNSKVLDAMGFSPKRLAEAVRIGFGRPSDATDIDEAADRISMAIKSLQED